MEDRAEKSFGDMKVTLFRCGAKAERTVLLPLGKSEHAGLLRLLDGAPLALAALDGLDWDRDLTPWPAPALFPGRVFAGGAEALLGRLTEEVLPWLSACGAPERLALAGYSLAGLFALWASTRTERFGRIVSMSGSLWYDGFTEDFGSQPCFAEQVYLSLGDREARARNPRMARVEEATDACAARIAAQGIPVRSVRHPGGHFRDVPMRMADGLLRGAAEAITPALPGPSPVPSPEH